MGRVLVGKGSRYLLHDRAFEIIGELPNQIFQILDLEFRTEHRVTLDEIYENLWAGKLRFSEMGKNTVEDRNGIRQYEVQDITQLPEERREEARFRLFAIKPLIAIQNESLSPHVNKRIEELNAEGHKVSRASLFRWIKAWRESNGDVRSLLSNYSKCGPQDNKLRKEVDIIIHQVVDKKYMKRESVTAKTVHELVCHTILQQNKQRSQEDQLELPSESTILRRIRDHDVYETVSKRHGKHHAFSNTVK